MRDVFTIHALDRQVYARYFAEREDRVRAGRAEPFEVIEEYDGVRGVIACRRVDDARERYATVNQMIPQESLDRLCNPDFVVQDVLDTISLQVRAMLDRS